MDIEKEKQKFQNYIKFALEDDIIANIFKDLLWGIIRYKERNKETAIKRLGEFVEHSHRYLFSILNNLIKNPIKLYTKKPKNLKIVKFLKDDIFPELNIEDILLIDKTREIFEDRSHLIHEYIPGKVKPLDQIYFPSIIINCIKLFLLDTCISYLSKRHHKILPNNSKKKKFKIENEFPNIFKESNDEILEIFLAILIPQEIKEKVLRKLIITPDDVWNSSVLQKYYPYYLFEHWMIDNLLNSSFVYPFRPDGPHLIDFKEGNWIFIPKIIINIFNLLSQCNKSILIKGTSGTGKTVISRYIGYKFFEKNYKVFYIDFLDHEKIKIEKVLGQLIRNIYNIDKKDRVLFIFENIHSLDRESLERLNQCKENLLCLCTQRFFKTENDDKEKSPLSFKKNQIFNLKSDSNLFKEIINGIIELNLHSEYAIKQIKSIGIQNLWIYGILLKLFQKYLEQNQKIPFVKILTDHALIGEEISKYLENLLENKQINYFSSQKNVYLNHIKYLMAIISIFSEYELWTEERFINRLISLRDNSPLGQLNRDATISEEIIMKIESYLIDIFELRKRDMKFKSAFSEIEFKIPHSQMAIIYKNCILKIFEQDYPGLSEQIINNYVLFGKYYGSFLHQLYLYQLRTRHFKNINEINKQFFNFESYLNYINYSEQAENHNHGLEIIKNHVLNRSIEENNLFFYCLGLYREELKNILFHDVFQDDNIIFNPIWKVKILESKVSAVFFFLYRIQKKIGNNEFIEFIQHFQKELLEKFKEDNGDYLFRLLYRISKIPIESWSNIFDLLVKLIKNSDIKIESFQSFYFRNEKFFNKVDENHIFYPLIKDFFEELIKKSSLQGDLQFFPSEYGSNMPLFTKLYLKIIEVVFNNQYDSESEFTQIFKQKIQDSKLITIVNFIIHLYSYDAKLSLLFFKKFLYLIKKKIYENNVDNVETFFDLLATDYKDEKQFLESVLLTDWEWFKGIFTKFSNEELFYFCKFRSIDYFFEELFPNYIKKYKDFILTLMKSRIKEYYDSLKNKIDIYKIFNFSLYDDLKNCISQLFNDSIYESLNNQNLSFYNNLFSNIEHSQLISYLKENWDFRIFISCSKFKEIISKSKNNELKKFFNNFYNEDPWKKILFEEYHNLLIERFGNNYKFFLKLSEEGLNFFNNLTEMVRNLEFVDIIKLYKYYSNPYSSRKNAFEFLHLRELIEENEEFLISKSFDNIIESLDITNLFNFLVILKVYHPRLTERFYKKNNKKIIEKLKKSSNVLGEIIAILLFFKLDFHFIRELERNKENNVSIFSIFEDWVREIDLCTLRYLIQANPASFLNVFNDFTIKNHVKNSSLLQIGLFLYKERIDIVREILGKIFIRKISFGGKVHKYPKMVELSTEQFSEMTHYLNPILNLDYCFLNSDYKSFSLLEHNELINNLISEKFEYFSNDITEKIKNSPLKDITFYFKSLITILNDFNKERFKITEELELFLTSESIKNKIKQAEFNDIYYFFKFLKIINPPLSKEIWQKYILLFDDIKFVRKLNKASFSRAFKFYDLFNKNHFQFRNESIKVLKQLILSKNLRELIQYLLGADINDVNFLISTFKNEILNVSKKSSKYDIANNFRGAFINRYDKKNLKLVKSIFKNRLKEKYFFES